MVLVFILLGIFVVLITFVLLVLSSSLHIEIKDLYASNIQRNKKLNYIIDISLYLFNKLKWLSIKLDNKKINKISKKMKLEDFNSTKFKQNFKLKDLSILKKLHIEISKFDLNLSLGTENVLLTSFIIFFISTITSILLSITNTNRKRNESKLKKHEKSNKDNIRKTQYKYSIQPIYKNKNLYEIYFNCIIQVKLVHIINVIYIFLKKGRSDLNEQSTSNRRSYGYSYE